MELREAIEKAGSEVTMALQVSVGAETHFSLVSYGDVVRQIITDFCKELGNKVARQNWSAVSEDPSEKFEEYIDKTKAEGLLGCWSWFAVGWVMGAPENQVLPKEPETFISVLKKTPKEELRLLEKRFSTEDFLRERFDQTLGNASMLISTIFSKHGTEMTEESVAKWSSIVTFMAGYEAYELGTRTRLLIEEDMTLSALSEQFE